MTPNRRPTLVLDLFFFLFFHPPLAAQCLGYVRCPPSSPTPSFEWREIPYSIETIPCFHALSLQARLGQLFLFLPIPSFPQPPLSEWRRNQLSLTWGWPLLPDSLTAGSHWPNRACLGFRWCRFLTWPAKLLTGPHKAESGFTAFFPSLSRWKPGKQQICVHGNLPGAQSQDENLIGKKRFSLPWLSLASPHHFFSRPPSHFSNSVLRSLFFVYSTANFEAAYP